MYANADHINDAAERSAALNLARLASAHRAGHCTTEEYTAAIKHRESFMEARELQRLQNKGA